MSAGKITHKSVKFFCFDRLETSPWSRFWVNLQCGTMAIQCQYIELSGCLRSELCTSRTLSQINTYLLPQRQCKLFYCCFMWEWLPLVVKLQSFYWRRRVLSDYGCQVAERDFSYQVSYTAKSLWSFKLQNFLILD